MTRRDYFGILLILAIVSGGFLAGKAWRKCSGRGGVYVVAVFHFACVEPRRP